MQPLFNRSCSVLDRLLQSTFPYNRHTPAESTEHLGMAPVALDISLEFLHPEIFIGPRDGGETTAVMPVPETAMDEHHRPVFGKYKIGRAGQLSHMESISKSSGEKKGAKLPFRPSILAANARHHAAALWRGGDTHGIECIPCGYFRGQQSQRCAAECMFKQSVNDIVFGSLPCL